MKTLDEILQSGQSIKVFYNENNINNQTRHIRAIVDNDYIVYRLWSKKRQDWLYKVAHRYEFELLYEDRYLK